MVSLLKPYHVPRPLTHFLRYLYQIGDYETCLQLVNTASNACKDKDSTVYAHLKIAAGTCYFDMNKLKDCRRDYEIALAIQEREGENNDLKASYMLHNMGNLETACSRLEEAETYYTKAIKSRTEGGDSAAFELALTCLCMARLYYLWGTYDQSKKYLSTAEGLFVRIYGPDTHLMAL
jgi:tetratricopeptide (TPR) repeat protein